MSTLPRDAGTAITARYARSATSAAATERRWQEADRRFARRERIAALTTAVDKMSMRLAQSEFNNGMWAGYGDQEKSQRYWRAARRQRTAMWRLLNALYAEAIR